MEALAEEAEHPFVVWMTTRNDQTHSKPGGLFLVAQFNYTNFYLPDSWSTNADALSPQREWTNPPSLPRRWIYHLEDRVAGRCRAAKRDRSSGWACPVVCNNICDSYRMAAMACADEVMVIIMNQENIERLNYYKRRSSAEPRWRWNLGTFIVRLLQNSRFYHWQQTKIFKLWFIWRTTDG